MTVRLCLLQGDQRWPVATEAYACPILVDYIKGVYMFLTVITNCTTLVILSASVSSMENVLGYHKAIAFS